MEKKEEKKNWNLELNLNRITMAEQLVHPNTFKDYRQIIIGLLQIKEMYFFEDEIFEECEPDNMEKVLSEYPNIIRTGAQRKNEDGTFSKKYLHLSPIYFVQPQDAWYDNFFAYKLRQLDLLEIDEFLDYHLENYYQNNLQEFSRFLRICIRKHEAKLLKPEISQTVNEWIDTKEKKEQQALQGIENQSAKIKKGKIKRESQDKLTCLSQEQTVLLMSFLQQERIFLKDEYLNKKDAGIAFEILTGYSQHTLRQNLSNAKDYQNKTNLKEIDNFLTRLKIAMDKALKEK
jgi:hypothetical protein